ncbi:hypothetical protein C3497_12635 [Zoogloeaceae bacteirum Par-f-2]|jgi:hypothetical protein|uniref:hypothetical protein n=1 Tax=Pseudothauera hydrothermalis TaxID=2184083 RepID=UPI000C7BD8F6|nr:hypothetical protein [Pseudothauera hydrothermalis]AUM01010.1 hypothetical protein B4966_13265 [Rhodocyclaceae bacterium]AVZ80172.1 hypothetical protein C3497_12635 [Zoogloeaceae bacteirum Par-f-2]
MSFFDSPIAPCTTVHEMVLLDETQQECAHEHHCPPERECPLAGCFTEVSGIDPTHAEQFKPAQRAP